MREPVGLILAGGRGTRMGNISKAGLMLGGESLLDRVQARLAPQVARIAVNANAPLRTPHPVLRDRLEGHLGPLAGVLTGLDWAAALGASHIVTVAVDTPYFPCDLVPRLLLAGDGGLAIAETSDGEHGTFGLWPVSLCAPLAAYLEQGGRKVRSFTAAQGAALARFPDTMPPAFFNINTPDDLARAADWL